MARIDFERIKDLINCYKYEVIAGGMVIGVVAVSTILTGCNEYGNYRLVQNTNEFIDLDNEDLYINSDGDYCMEFEEGEHVITKSKTCGSKLTYEPVEGYTIQSATFDASRYYSEVTYVNTEDVIAIGELDNNNQVEFNEFGKVKKRVR